MPISVGVDAVFEGLDELLLELEQHNKEVQAGVASVGEAAAYALNWEWGNARQTQPGPKTVLGTNPDGKMVWLSIQAPFGYIRINESEYWKIIDQVVSELNFNQLTAQGMTKELERGARKISHLIAEVMKMYVPVASGDLKDSIRAVDPNDPILTTETDEYETLELQGE